MKDPQFPIEITPGQWNLIATGVTSGIIHMKNGAKLWQTFRLTEKSELDPPTLKSEGVEIRQNREGEEPIDSSKPIDVYVWSEIIATLRVDV